MTAQPTEDSGIRVLLLPADDEYVVKIPRGMVATEQAKRVIAMQKRFLGLFLEKNRKYKGLAEGNVLGAKGKFVDVFRKTMVLKTRIWDGEEVVGEDNREVILDMIGHLFLMLDDFDQE